MSDELEPRMITEDVYGPDLDDGAKLTDFIDQLRAAYLEIPAEYRDIAVLDVGGCDWFNIKYERPETDAEYAQRCLAVFHDNEHRAARERAEYDRLRKKFEGK